MLRGFATINYWTDDMEAPSGGMPSCWPSSRISSAQGRMAASPMSSSGLVTTRPSWAWSIAAGHRPVRRRGRVGRSCTGASRMSPRRSKSCWRWGYGIPADHASRGRIRDRGRGGSVRERVGRHVQPALPRDPGFRRAGVVRVCGRLHTREPRLGCAVVACRTRPRAGIWHVDTALVWWPAVVARRHRTGPQLNSVSPGNRLV